MTRKLTIAIAGVGLVGVGVATYLVYIHYAGIEPFCVASGGCEKVQSSRYADFLGVPVALLGLIGYITILLSLLIRGDLGRAITALLALTGFGFSLYLTYLELFRIKAICQWCVVSAILMTILMVLAMFRLLSVTTDELLAGDAGAPETGEQAGSDDEPQ